MLTLRSDRGDSLVIAPEHGASIVGWTDSSGSLLRRTRPEAAVAGNPSAMGCFPLLPYANRIAQGRFAWRGQTHRLALNFGDHPHAIHGVGWHRPWTVDSVTADSVRLSLAHLGGPAWPFAFAAEITYALQEDGLVVTISATNRHTEPAPMGIGLHPFFARAADARLRFAARGVWVNGADSLPRQHGAEPATWDHSQGLPVADDRLDNCFTGWDTPAQLDAGPVALTLDASGVFPNLQVFTPTGADFYCAEPVSHVPDAINRPDLPSGQAMQVLAPGETLSGTIRMRRRDTASFPAAGTS
jgi:aldose 1-epimerase